MSFEQLLQAARKLIAVEDDELAEARRRRQLLSKALRKAFPGSIVYFNGSVAHGDANTPLTDIDLGVIVGGAESEYGPGKLGPRALMEAARDVIRTDLSEEFPNLRVTIEGQRRAVLVNFGDPVTPGTKDFTADVIVAIDNLRGPGIFIPNLPDEGWEPSDPQEHTRLVSGANRKTLSTFAQLVRLLKHWNLEHGIPLCSWNIKALALECINSPSAMAKALDVFFKHAVVSLSAGPTEDPAGVSGTIDMNLTKTEVISRVEYGADLIARAIAAENEGRHVMAQHCLSRLLPDIVPDVDPDDLREEEAERLEKEARRRRSTGVGAGSSIALPATRAWGE